MNAPFIDIHTHASTKAEELLSVQSFHLEDIDSKDPVNSFFTAAIHPWHASKFSEKEILVMLEGLLANNNFIGVGETGLDKACKVEFNIQKKVLQLQISFAEVHQFPLIIHSVRSWNEIIPFLKRSSVPCVLHGYSEGSILTRQLIDLGCYFSVGKSILKPTERLLEAIRMIPLSLLFLETDEAKVSVQELYHQMSKILDLPLDLLKIQIYNNFTSLFSSLSDR